MALQIGNEQLMSIPHDHVGDVAAPVDHDAELAVQRARHLGHATAELVRDPGLCRHAPLVEGLELPVLAGLQALGIAVECWNDRLSGGHGSNPMRCPWLAHPSFGRPPEGCRSPYLP